MDQPNDSTGTRTGRRSIIKAPQDFVGGALLIAFATWGWWLASNLPGLRRFTMGAGTTPRLFAGTLMFVGALIVIQSLLKEGPPLERPNLRDRWFWIGGAILVGLIVVVLAPLFTSTPAMALGLTALFALSLILLAIRGLPFVLAGIVVFAITLPVLGLVIAAILSVLISSFGDETVKPLQSAISAVLLAAGSVALFSYALGLPIPVWPRF